MPDIDIDIDIDTWHMLRWHICWRPDILLIKTNKHWNIFVSPTQITSNWSPTGLLVLELCCLIMPLMIKINRKKHVYLMVSLFLLLVTMTSTSESIQIEGCRQLDFIFPFDFKFFMRFCKNCLLLPKLNEIFFNSSLCCVGFGWKCRPRRRSPPPSPSRARPCFVPYSVEHCNDHDCGHTCDTHGHHFGGYCKQEAYPMCCCH